MINLVLGLTFLGMGFTTCVMAVWPDDKPASCAGELFLRSMIMFLGASLITVGGIILQWVV